MDSETENTVTIPFLNELSSFVPTTNGLPMICSHHQYHGTTFQNDTCQNASNFSRFLGTGTCFICLDGPEEDNTTNPVVATSSSSSSQIKKKQETKKHLRGSELIHCCSQCYTVVHRRCWKEWRRNQKLSILRARLLAQTQPNILACSVCKTGVAGLFDQKKQSYETLVTDTDNYAVREHIQNELFQVIGRMLTEGNDDTDEEGPPCCSIPILIVNGVIALIIIITNIFLIWVLKYYAGDVVLWSLYVSYIAMSIELLVLSIVQRRKALGPLMHRPARVSTDMNQIGEQYDFNVEENISTVSVEPLPHV